jgi:hypothetical protein
MQQLSYPAAAPVEAGGEHRPDAPRRCGVPKRDTSPPEVDRLASRRTTMGPGARLSHELSRAESRCLGGVAGGYRFMTTLRR